MRISNRRIQRLSPPSCPFQPWLQRRRRPRPRYCNPTISPLATSVQNKRPFHHFRDWLRACTWRMTRPSCWETAWTTPGAATSSSPGAASRICRAAITTGPSSTSPFRDWLLAKKASSGWCRAAGTCPPARAACAILVHRCGRWISIPSSSKTRLAMCPQNGSTT